MSRLPEFPDLEHLRDQAKDLLRERRASDPDAQLSDALHAIAKQYGFLTWSALKAHVVSRQRGRPSNPFVGRWTIRRDRSTLHPLHTFQHATMEFVVAGNTVTMVSTTIDASGDELRGRISVEADGRERETPEGGPYSITARWVGTHRLETIARQDGEVVGQGVYEVSVDDAELVVLSKNARANANGWASEADTRLVFKRA